MGLLHTSARPQAIALEGATKRLKEEANMGNRTVTATQDEYSTRRAVTFCIKRLLYVQIEKAVRAS